MKQLNFDFPIPEGHEIIFRASKTLQNGTVIYAKNYGLRGFPILIEIVKD